MPVPTSNELSLGAGPSRQENTSSNEWVEQFFARVHEAHPTQYILIKDLVENRPYVIETLVKTSRGFGEVLEATIHTTTTTQAIVSLPRRYANVFDAGFLEKYEANTIAMIYRGLIGRAYNVEFIEVDPTEVSCYLSEPSTSPSTLPPPT